jgi:hypothetical protein
VVVQPCEHVSFVRKIDERLFWPSIFSPLLKRKNKEMRKDGEIRVLPSSPDYEEIDQLTSKIAILKNPHLHKIAQDIPQAELKAILLECEQELQDLLDFQRLPFNKVLQNMA